MSLNDTVCDAIDPDFDINDRGRMVEGFGSSNSCS